jgi:hypothetical protein
MVGEPGLVLDDEPVQLGLAPEYGAQARLDAYRAQPCSERPFFFWT